MQSLYASLLASLLHKSPGYLSLDSIVPRGLKEDMDADSHFRRGWVSKQQNVSFDSLIEVCGLSGFGKASLAFNCVTVRHPQALRQQLAAGGQRPDVQVAYVSVERRRGHVQRWWCGPSPK